MKLFGLTTDSVPGIAFMKLFDALPIVATVILVARLGGLRLADLYLQNGKIKAWLVVGIVSFVAFAVLFLLQARDQDIPADRLLAHAPVQYAPNILWFLAILLVLSLAWGYVIQKTESLWGSVLFHAGADLLIIVGIFETYGIS